jgi:hypothetical protein
MRAAMSKSRATEDELDTEVALVDRELEEDVLRDVALELVLLLCVLEVLSLYPKVDKDEDS